MDNHEQINIDMPSYSHIMPSTQSYIEALPSYLQAPPIAQEVLGAQTRFTCIQNAVSKRYRANESTVSDLPETLRHYLAHNEEVLASTIWLCRLLHLDDRQKRIVEAAAIGHDIAKADPPPLSALPDYILIKHPQIGADIVGEILRQQSNDFWKNIQPHQKKENFIQEVKQAIASHSGPIPGFMQNCLNKYNKEAESQGKKQISLPTIDSNHIPSVVLLIADMIGLGTTTGVKKIVEIRKNNPKFEYEDAHQAKINNIPPEKVRIESALTSARQGINMVMDSMSQSPTLNKYANQVEFLMKGVLESTKTALMVDA